MDADRWKCCGNKGWNPSWDTFGLFPTTKLEKRDIFDFMHHSNPRLIESNTNKKLDGTVLKMKQMPALYTP